MKSDNVIVIDLDDTLLNSYLMYKIAIYNLKFLGVNHRNFWNADRKEYQQREGKNKMYSFSDHMKILAANVRVDVQKISDSVLNFVGENSGNFLYNDCVDFLFSFKRIANLILMTSGPKDLQSAKLKGISASGFALAEYFKRIVIVNMPKGHCIGEVCSPDNRLNVFIDDSPRQINSVAKERPDIVTIWLDRKEKKANKDRQGDVPDCDYTAQNFYKINDILSEIL